MFTVFKDLDKDVSDNLKDDFDSKFSLKIKSAGPIATTLTTNIELVDKDGKCSLKPKVSLKWPHESGFAVDKLEFTNDCRMTAETSLSKFVDGLKLEFKGNDDNKGDLSFTYSVRDVATVYGEMDLVNLSKFEAAVTAGHGNVVGGVNAQYTAGKDINVGLAVTHTVPNVCFTAVRAKDNFTAFNALFSYSSISKLVLAGSAHHCAKKTTATGLASYKIDDKTTVKGKIDTTGVLAASIKRSLDKNFSVVGSVEVPSDFKSVKWGLNATLG